MTGDRVDRPNRPTSTRHAPHCPRPGWDVEKYPHTWVLRCRQCGAVQLADPEVDPDRDGG